MLGTHELFEWDDPYWPSLWHRGESAGASTLAANPPSEQEVEASFEQMQNVRESSSSEQIAEIAYSEGSSTPPSSHHGDQRLYWLLYDQDQFPKDSITAMILRGLEQPQLGSIYDLIARPRNGRPVENLDLSGLGRKLRSKYSKFLDTLEVLDSQRDTKYRDRCDFYLTTLMRQTKGLLRPILKKEGSDVDSSQLRSTNRKIFVFACLKRFINLFKPHFLSNSANELFHLFLDYMVLLFPKAKVNTILEILEGESSICQSRQSELQSQLDIIAGKSKELNVELVSKNSCLKLLVEKFQKDAGRLGLDNIVETYDKVLGADSEASTHP